MLKQNVVITEYFRRDNKTAIAALALEPRVKLVSVYNGAIPRLELYDVLTAAKHRLTLEYAVYLNMLVPVRAKSISSEAVEINSQRKGLRWYILV